MGRKITAKAQCNFKHTYEVGGETHATLGFCADYGAGKNAEWAASTPHLDVRLTVKGAVADLFHSGEPYTLTFEREEDES